MERLMVVCGICVRAPDRTGARLNNNFAMPKLIFTGEHFAGRIYELTLEKTTVGRGGQNTLALHDPSVSLAHCEILIHGAEVIVRDLGSANGTFVNGIRLDHQQCQMKTGQTLQFGSVSARLDLGQPAWEDTASEETALFAVSRAERDQRRKEKKPGPVSATATFDDGAEGGANLADRTIVLPRVSSREPATQPPAPQKPVVRPHKLKLVLWLVVALILGLAFWLGLMWGRK